MRAWEGGRLERMSAPAEEQVESATGGEAASLPTWYR